MLESKKLIEKVKHLFNFQLPDDFKIKRQYPGKWQAYEMESCWTSYYYTKKNKDLIIGIFTPVRKLLKCPNLIIEQAGVYFYSIICGCPNNDYSCNGLKGGPNV